MADANARLRARLSDELALPVSPEARRLADAIRARHAGAALAVVFYGSCLRRGDSDGIHDFYAVVDDYDSAYASRALALANALLPPNVFYLEQEHGGATLRAKYAVVSRDDLARACRGETRRAGLWARFAQPVAAAWVRDALARDSLVTACADAVDTAVRCALSLGDGKERSGAEEWQSVESSRLWRALWRATYATEWRPERAGASDAIYDARRERFDAVLADALAVLAEAGAVDLDPEGNPPRVRLRAAPTTLPHPVAAKGLAALQLAKSALTFGDWLPYALWKVERHSGVRLEASARQRRHPWLFAWPLVFRALRTRALR